MLLPSAVAAICKVTRGCEPAETQVRTFSVSPLVAGTVSVFDRPVEKQLIPRTARFLAARRAVATELGSPLVNDPFAHLFAEDELLQLARTTVHEPHYVLLRHRLLEDFLCAPPLPSQTLILGAGLDTKYARIEALRQGPFWEVDRTDVLAYKADILHQHRLPVAPSLAVSVKSVADFESMILQRTDPALPTAIIAEGFFMYQPEETIFAALDLVCRYYERGVRIGFDLFAPAAISDSEFRAVRDRVEAYGEILQSFIESEQVRDFLQARGAQIEIWTAERLQEHYLGGSWTGMRGLYTCCATTMACG